MIKKSICYRHTIDKYIRHLQEAYLVFSIPRFSFKVKDQAGHNKKIYCADNGLAISAGFCFSPDRGALYENLVAVALKKSKSPVGFLCSTGRAHRTRKWILL